MDIAILSKDDVVNEAVSQRLAESRLAGNGDKAFSVVMQLNPYNKSREKEVSSESSLLEC